ncbi:MAG: 3-isopropylmalate dehydrogenase [Bacteroidetes bacterium]|nr:3-isopropylmalate dehydrogenase [Bacteroidota bacterium]
MDVKIALLPGDGIGPEVIDSAVKVLDEVCEKFNVSLKYTTYPFGGISYDNFGTPITDETLQGCYDSGVVLLGAVGGPKWEDLQHNLKPEAALLKLRKSLRLFANVRPAKVYPSMISSSTLKEEVIKGIDLVIFRELTGGIYFGEPRGIDKKQGWNTMLYTEEEIVKIARKAFEAARLRRQKVTSVDKANVLEVSQFWRQTVRKVHTEFPDVGLDNMYVDNAAMQLVKDPGQFDVILTSNLFGDILSDISSMVTGGLGMLPSASIGEKYALYEPVHGSAPEIANTNSANPIAAISSVAMMLSNSFGMNKGAEIIESSIERVLAEGYRTQDIALQNSTVVSTTKMTELIINNIKDIYNEQAIGVFLL